MKLKKSIFKKNKIEPIVLYDRAKEEEKALAKAAEQKKEEEAATEVLEETAEETVDETVEEIAGDVQVGEETIGEAETIDEAESVNEVEVTDETETFDDASDNDASTDIAVDEVIDDSTDEVASGEEKQDIQESDKESVETEEVTAPKQGIILNNYASLNIRKEEKVEEASNSSEAKADKDKIKVEKLSKSASHKKIVDSGKPKEKELTEKTEIINDALDKRAIRRKNRIKAQIMAYATVAVFFVAMISIIVVLISNIKTNEENERETIAEQQVIVDNLIGEEEELIVPEVEEVVEEEIIPELTDAQKLDEIVNAAIEVMPLEDKVAGLFIVTPEGLTKVNKAVQAGEGTQKALADYAVGGVVYFESNIKNADQIKEMVDNTVLYSRYPLFIAVDEEGGTVSRLAKAGIANAAASPRVIGMAGNASSAYTAGASIAEYLKEYGFNLDFAPVGDIIVTEGSPLTDRSYGTDADAVSNFVVSMMNGLQEQGVTACVKHFPGIGSTLEDTENGIAVSNRTEEQFRENEFKVFQAAIDNGANMIMIGHMAAPSLTGGDNTPCTFSSRVVTDILRGEMNYDGVIISDALNMGAISNYYASDEAAIIALKAGCDMLLMPENFEIAYEGVMNAINNGTISEERINDSLRRIYRIKYADRIQ